MHLYSDAHGKRIPSGFQNKNLNKVGLHEIHNVEISFDSVGIETFYIVKYLNWYSKMLYFLSRCSKLCFLHLNFSPLTPDKDRLIVFTVNYSI